MAIWIPQPSMVVASEHAYSYRLGDVWIPYTTRKYNMWNTYDVADSIPLEHMIDWVAAVADGAPDHYLRVVIITCHANPGTLRIANPISNRNVELPQIPLFSKWRNRVANIWIIACNVAYKMPTRQWDGNLFCSAFAKHTGAYVVASADEQMGDMNPILPWGHVDDWEGLVRRYEPEHGSVDWHHQYPSGIAAEVGLTALVRHDPMTPPIAVPPGFRAHLGGPGTFWSNPQPLRRLPHAPRGGMYW